MKIYCLHCQKQVTAINPRKVATNNGRERISATCPICHGGLSRMLPASQGGSILNDAMNSASGVLPELHMRTILQRPIGKKYSFAGPLTRLDQRLRADGTPKEWSKPINRVDALALVHDKFYEAHVSVPERHTADRMMMEQMKLIKSPTAEERLARKIITEIFKRKIQFGMGLVSSSGAGFWGKMFGSKHNILSFEFGIVVMKLEVFIS